MLMSKASVAKTKSGAYDMDTQQAYTGYKDHDSSNAGNHFIFYR